jgi:hypothetical protein
MIVVNSLLCNLSFYRDLEFVTSVDPRCHVFTGKVIAQNRCTSRLAKRSDFDVQVNGVLLP